MSSVAPESGERAYARGKVCSWTGGVLWIGTGGDATGDVHAHHALQLSFSDHPPVAFRSGRADAWIEYIGCLIPADLPHAIDASHRPYANIFVDPETAEGRSLRDWLGARRQSGEIARLDDAESRAAAALLYGTWADGGDNARLESAARDVVRRFAGTSPPRVVADPRVLGAIELVRARLDGRVTLPDVARELHVSPSRLRHLFVDEVGLPFRTFVLWERLRRVIEALGTESLTQVALAAGFADAAHMTRTFRRMLGFPPSLLRHL